MTYIAVYFYGFITSLRKCSAFYLFSYVVILWLLASFRYGVGPDYFAYKDLYLSLSESVADEIESVSGQEPIFRLIGSLMRSYSFSYELYSSIIALVSLAYIAISVNKYSRNPSLSLLIYYSFFYLVWTYSGIRQGLTLSIGTYYFLACLESKKTGKFYGIVFLLTLIHASSIVLLFLYHCATVNLKKSTLAWFAVLSVILSFIPMQDYLGLFDFIPNIDRILIYSNNFNVESVKILDFKSVSRLAFLAFGFYAYSIFRKDELQRKVVVAYIISFVAYFSLKFSEVLAANLSMYGFILAIIIIPNICSEIQAKFRIHYSAMVYALTILFLLKNLSGMEDMAGLIHSEFITPYTHIFAPQEYQILGPR